MVSRKDFKPTLGHRVFCEHFVGGKKTYMNNTPTITPKTAKQTPQYGRKTVKARVFAEHFKGHQQPEEHLHDEYLPENDSLPMQSEEAGNGNNNTEELLRAQIADLLLENSELKKNKSNSSWRKSHRKGRQENLVLKRSNMMTNYSIFTRIFLTTQHSKLFSDFLDLL